MKLCGSLVEGEGRLNREGARKVGKRKGGGEKGENNEGPRSGYNDRTIESSNHDLDGSHVRRRGAGRCRFRLHLTRHSHSLKEGRNA